MVVEEGRMRNRILDTPTDRFPDLRARRHPKSSPQFAAARQALQRAQQEGRLTAEEFVKTVRQLEPPPAEPE
jgi:hypothetical protein